MAKVGLGVGIDFDVTGLQKGMQQATGELEKLRGITNRIGGSIHAAMAMPVMSFLSSVMQANEEARKIRADLMAPFSEKMMQAQINADLMKMQAGQRMVAAGLDEAAARKITVDANKEVATALMARDEGAIASKSVESFMTHPGDYITNLVRAGEGWMQQIGAVGSEMLGGNLLAGFTGEFDDRRNRAAFELGGTTSTAAMAMATGQTGNMEGLTLQLLRQTEILEAIDRNTKGNR